MIQEITQAIDVGALPDGVYYASSLTLGYGAVLSAIEADEATFAGENIDEHGVTRVAVRVGKRRNPAIGISREFFTTVLKDYADWREKWWREAVQNSVDAGATKIDCLVQQNDDGTFTVSTQDDGGGMTEEILVDKFLMLGGSTKKLGSGAAGGFGKAKELLILPWLSWRVHTRDRIVDGSGIDYSIRSAPYLDGTRVEVVMPADQATNNAAAISFIGKCYLPQIRFTVSSTRLDGTVDTQRPRADLRGTSVIEEIPGKAEIYMLDIDGDSYSMYVRVHGIYMFSTWVSSMKGKQLVAEITAPSIEILTANRDGFRDRDVQRGIDKLTEKLSKDVLSALRSKKGLIRRKYQGAGKFAAERARAEALAQISYVPPTDNGHTEILASDIEVIASVMGDASARALRAHPGQSIRLPDGDLTRELLTSVSYTGSYHVEEAIRQLSWEPDFFVINEVEGFRVPKKFMPESMTPTVVKLARVWTEMCRYVLMQLGNFRPFGVGFIFSESAVAAYQRDEDEHWLLLNPFRDSRSRKQQWVPGKPEDLKQIYASAIHECTHLADGIEYHDEAFSTALTNNIAKTADGFRKIRKIVGAIRVGESAKADVYRNPDEIGERELEYLRIYDAPDPSKASKASMDFHRKFSRAEWAETVRRLEALGMVRRDMGGVARTDMGAAAVGSPVRARRRNTTYASPARKIANL